MGPEVVVPVVGMMVPIVALACGAVVVYLALRHGRQKRELLSRERLAAIEKGLEVPLLDIPEPRHDESPLQSALVVLGVGIAVTFALWLLMGTHSPWAFGLIPAFVGVAKLIHWFAGGREDWERQRALDEELRRAYIERLRGGSAPAKSETAAAD
jgi:hypothetical protein